MNTQLDCRPTRPTTSRTEASLFWMAQAAENAAIAGDYDGADQLLSKLLARQHGSPELVGPAAVTVHARAGRLDKALEIYLALQADQLLSADRTLRAEFELARATLAGDEDTAHLTLRPALQAVKDLGQDTRARELTAASNRPQLGRRPLMVHLFGQFRLHYSDGRTVVPRRGRTADLIKLLVLRGGQIHAECAIDLLWCNVDLKTGRRRLKTILNRARLLIGPEWLRREGDLIMLDDDVASDFSDFLDLAARARQCVAQGGDDTGLAQRALEVARPGLLPEDPYADWSTDDRWQIESTVAGLIDGMIAQATSQSALEWIVRYCQDQRLRDPELFARIARTAQSLGVQSTAELADQLASR